MNCAKVAAKQCDPIRENNAAHSVRARQIAAAHDGTKSGVLVHWRDLPALE